MDIAYVILLTKPGGAKFYVNKINQYYTLVSSLTDAVHYQLGDAQLVVLWIAGLFPTTWLLTIPQIQAAWSLT
jgi:hypothetical protein